MNEPVKQETQLPTLGSSPEVPQQEVLASDMVIPKLLLMQGLSDFVSDRAKDPVTGQEIRQGDVVRSTTGQVLGGPDKPFPIIPLRYTSLWMHQERIPGKTKPEFRGYVPRDAGLHDPGKGEIEKTGENLPWEFKHLGAEWVRTKVIRLYALLPGDIDSFLSMIERVKESGEMPDLEHALLPVVIDFRNTSYAAGKDVASYFLKIREMAQYGAQPYGYSMLLGCGKEENDKGVFYVYQAGKTEKLAAKFITEAKRWYATLGHANIKVDERDAADDVPAAKPQGEAGVSQQSKF